MERKELLGIVIKVAIYALSLVAAALGVSAITSCAFDVGRSSSITGRATIVTVDTTVVTHGGFVEFKKK